MNMQQSAGQVLPVYQPNDHTELVCNQLFLALSRRLVLSLQQQLCFAFYLVEVTSFIAVYYLASQRLSCELYVRRELNSFSDSILVSHGCRVDLIGFLSIISMEIYYKIVKRFLIIRPQRNVYGFFHALNLF